MSLSAAASRISVIIPVEQRVSDVRALYADYKQGLDACGMPYELIYVLDGPHPELLPDLKSLQLAGEPVLIVQLTRNFGEATAIMAGAERAAGETLLTLPAYFQIEGSEIPKLVRALAECDVAIGYRQPRAGGTFERLRRSAFHGLLGSVTGAKFHDLGCGARAMKRRVLEEISLYGDQHRFVAVLADHHGFPVREIPVAQSPRDRFEGAYRPRDYTRGFLDIFTVFFLVRFTKKPLRFFGMMGATTFAIGAVLLAWIIIQRIAFSYPLAERPLLLLSSLLVVLGLQLFALGLLGELIIFTHAQSVKGYQVAEVVEFPDVASATSEAVPAALLRYADTSTR
jgi:glycosyltransferase involved in cell wall biosynthesis